MGFFENGIGICVSKKMEVNFCLGEAMLTF